MGMRILLVEGDDDQHVMRNLFGVRQIPETFRVERPKPEGALDQGREAKEGDGDTVLLESIPRWLLETEIECLAVVIDANNKGAEARWQSIRSRLLNSGYHDVPEKHDPAGTVFALPHRSITPRTIRFGVWIMPDNKSPGVLEDFVAGMIHEGDEMLSRVDAFLGSIPPDERRFSDAHQPKARVHCWLAVSERPGRPMGQAIQADRHLDANHPSVGPFLDWINRAMVD